MTDSAPLAEGACHWTDEGEWVACPSCFSLPDGGCASTVGRLRSVIETTNGMLDDGVEIADAVLAFFRELPVEQRMEAMGMERFGKAARISGTGVRHAYIEKEQPVASEHSAPAITTSSKTDERSR